jgi:hypothetical protein
MTLVVPQISHVGVAHALGMGWTQGGPSSTRLVGVDSSNDGMIAYATENPTPRLGTARKIWKTVDAGLTWTELANAPSMYWGAVATSSDGQIVVALGLPSLGADQIVYRSLDAGATWNPVYTSAEELNDIAVSDSGDIVVIATSVGVLKSTNGGTNFSALAYGDAAKTIDMSSDGLKIVVANDGSAISKSVNGGANWVALTESGTNWNQIAISDDGMTIMGVAKGNAAGVMSSRDGGVTFTSANIGSTFADQATFAGMSDDGLVLIASSYGSVPQMSTDGGLTWSASGLPAVGWTGFALSDSGVPTRGIIAITENARVFSYGPIPSPLISSISPTAGATSGGRGVTIFGSHFINVTGVSFGSTPALSFVVESQSRIIAVTPPQSAGEVNVTVTTESGTSNSTATFTYEPVVIPTIDSVTPNSGSPTGGTYATLSGSGFRDIISITVGGEPSDYFYVLDDNELVFEVPAGDVGTVSIVLITDGGTATLVNGFTYDEALRPPVMGWTGLSSSPTDGDIGGSVSKIVRDSRGSIYILGEFENASADPSADFVARWSGSSWVGLGSNGAGGSSFECDNQPCYFNDLVIAPNDDVYVGGSFKLAGQSVFSSVAKWNGTNWTAVGTESFYVSAMAVDDENHLVVVGDFENLSGIPEADFIAKWDGTSWSALGSDGSGDGALNARGYSVTFGSQSSLYVSGEFTDVGGNTSSDYIVKWNGSAWESLGELSVDGDELEPIGYSLLVDSSSGSDVLYVGGCMYWAGHDEVPVAKWDGTMWSVLNSDSPLLGCVYDMALAPTGALVAVGQLYLSNFGEPSIAVSWDGNEWRSLENEGVLFSSVVVTDDGRLIVGGSFEDLGDSANADWLAISQPVVRLRNVGTSATVSPNIGTELGGTTVTLTGTHFSQATQVKFGTKVATNLTVVSANSISVTTPANAPGVVDVSIISPSGTRVFPGAFTYFEPVSSVVDTEEEVLLLPEQSITPSIQFVAGDSQTISVPGFVPGERVQLLLASTPQLLASTTADANRVATFTFVFPRDVVGFHTLAVFAPVSARGMRQAIFIHPVGTVIGLGALPKTGSEIQLWLPFVIAILGFLLITISGNRRRKIA